MAGSVPEPGSLAAVGLSSPEETAYRRLVGSGPATIGEISAGWPHQESVRSTVEQLRRRGFASRVPGRPIRYRAIPPHTAFEAALADRAERLCLARQHAESLGRLQQAAAPMDESDVVEQVVGRHEVLETVDRALRSTRSRLWLLVRDPLPGRRIDDVISDLHGSVADVRVVCADPADLDQQTMGAFPAGAIRVSGSVPASIYLIDDRLAVVMTDDEAASALLVRPCELLTVLGLLAEALWEDAGPAMPDDDDLVIVDLLLRGLTDVAIARAIGVSPRTAQRRVAALMQPAGARTRFQAGVQAALRRRASAPDRSH